jgi:hypothetical protein
MKKCREMWNLKKLERKSIVRFYKEHINFFMWKSSGRHDCPHLNNKVSFGLYNGRDALLRPIWSPSFIDEKCNYVFE